VSKTVFISYRREDTAPSAGRVYDRLCQLLSRADVFFDVGAIKGGENFADKIVAEIAKCDVVLVLIGRRWLESGQPDGRPRLFDPTDYVRAEVRAALQRNVLVLPILVDGAQMPAPKSLPDDVKALSARNAVPLRHESFDDDVENIARHIFGASAKERPWEDKGRIGTKIGYSVAGTAAALIVVLIGAYLHRLTLLRPLSASIGDAATTLLLFVAAALGAVLGLGYERRRRKRKLRR
jgi:hypothetical protein